MGFCHVGFESWCELAATGASAELAGRVGLLATELLKGYHRTPLRELFCSSLFSHTEVLRETRSQILVHLVPAKRKGEK